MKKIAILQSNFIPWKGYFDIMNSVDEFILYDEMQYTRHDWRNRNQMKTSSGTAWITIPIDTKGKFDQKINEARVLDHHWCKKHVNAWKMNYSRAPYFKEYFPRFEALYEHCKEEEYLSQINYLFMKEICDCLGITTKISWSTDYTLTEGKTERLVNLVRDAGGTEYLSGPAARDYIEDHFFEEAGIALKYMSYEGYAEYPQLFGEFTHNVSVLDLIFNTGDQARNYLLSNRNAL